MEKFNVSAFYRLGGMIRQHYRTFATWETHMPERVKALYELKACFALFLGYSGDTNWKATRDRADEILKWLEFRAQGSGAELDVSPFEAGYETRLSQLLKSFEETFASESQDANVFSVSQKGTHATLDLMQRAADNLPPEVRSRLTSEAQTDIREAGRCLALDCHTAAGLHILRAVESMITIYMAKLTKKPVRRQDRNWGVYLRELNKANADKKLTGYLLHIKDYYRNPLMHPEQVLDANEAFSLFNASLSAIIQIDAAIEACP